LRHFSVGTILKRQGGKGEEYLLFRRRIQPAGCYTIPAGHLEIGETPEEGARREGYEETQLGILSAEYFYEGEIQEGCRRGSNWHYWYLYLCQCVGEARLPDEADVIGWFSRDEIIKELKLTEPAGIFFNKLFGEEPYHITNG
jgi:ADP-ribose pyrophosphatase YjhB (NUDIX family)